MDRERPRKSTWTASGLTEKHAIEKVFKGDCWQGEPPFAAHDEAAEIGGQAYRVTVERIASRPAPAPRFSVASDHEEAERDGPQRATWSDALRELEWLNDNAAVREWAGPFRIWDHSETPPVDVTDKDPDDEVFDDSVTLGSVSAPEPDTTDWPWWDCWWEDRSISVDKVMGQRRGWGTISRGNGSLRSAWCYVQHPTEPTEAEARAFIEAACGVTLPEEDVERWQVRGYNGVWRDSVSSGWGTTIDVDWDNKTWSLRIWTNNRDRDAKAEALHRALLAAGKPQEGE